MNETKHENPALMPTSAKVFLSIMFFIAVVLILYVVIDPRIRSGCDVKKRQCWDNKTKTSQVCEGDTLVISKHGLLSDSVTTIAESPKCVAVDGLERKPE